MPARDGGGRLLGRRRAQHLLGGGTARRVATVAVILVLIALGRVITDVARGLLEAFTDDLDEAEDEARAEAEEALFGGGEFLPGVGSMSALDG